MIDGNHFFDNLKGFLHSRNQIQDARLDLEVELDSVILK
jgi:hypothetical protein